MPDFAVKSVFCADLIFSADGSIIDTFINQEVCLTIKCRYPIMREDMISEGTTKTGANIAVILLAPFQPSQCEGQGNCGKNMYGANKVVMKERTGRSHVWVRKQLTVAVSLSVVFHIQSSPAPIQSFWGGHMEYAYFRIPS